MTCGYRAAPYDTYQSGNFTEEAQVLGICAYGYILQTGRQRRKVSKRAATYKLPANLHATRRIHQVFY